MKKILFIYRHSEGGAKPPKDIVILRRSRRIPFVLALLLILLALTAVVTSVIYGLPSTGAIVGMHQAGAGPKARMGYPSRQPAALTNGLVGWWKLDGDATDSTGNGHNGTVTGGTYDKGFFGNSLSLSGTSQYAEVPYSAALTPTDTMSFSVWAYQSVTQTRTIASFGNYSTKQIWRLQTGGNSYYTLQVCIAATDADNCSNRGVTPDSTWVYGQWHHIVFAYNGAGATDADKLKIYIDGQPQTLTFTGTIPANLLTGSEALSHFQLGDIYNSASQSWAGLLDDARFYNRELSAAEVATLYNSTAPPACDQTCLAWWKLDESGTTDTAADSSGHGYTGTLNNFGFTNKDWTGWMAGRHNSGLAFYGGDDYVLTNTNSTDFDATATPLTVTAWVYRRTSYGLGIISKGGVGTSNTGGWSMLFSGDTTNRMYVRIYRSTSPAVSYTPAISAANMTVPPLTWAHIAATFKVDTVTLNNNTIEIYINGVKDTSGTLSRAYLPVVSTAKVKLGVASTNDDATLSAYGNGILDDVRIYNRALEPYEIYNLYAAGR